MNRNKVICKCRKLTKGDVADAVEQGAVSFRQVKKATRAGDACGHCQKKIKKLIRKLTRIIIRRRKSGADSKRVQRSRNGVG